MENYKLTGNESFILNDKDTEMNILDFWRWHFCDRFDLQDKIAEYIVAKALGLSEADNTGTWTLFDIYYRGKRIEVKETSYYHSWQSDEEPKSNVRNFGINKAYSVYQDSSSKYERQNDIYVFCLNTGMTKSESNPLNLNNWEFYIVKTSVINAECNDSKTISLSRVRKLSKMFSYEMIKNEIDSIIDECDIK